MNGMRSFLLAVSVLVAPFPSVGLAAEWIKTVKPMPDVGGAIKVGDEFRVRSTMGAGDDKVYTIVYMIERIGDE